MNKHRDYLIPVLLLLIGLVSIGYRMSINYDFHESALVYVGGPYLIAIWLSIFLSKSEKGSFGRLMRTSLIVLLGSSVVLFEGFLCVAMFMPIYFFVVIIGHLISKTAQRHPNRLSSHILMCLPLLLALEGVSPLLSFERDYNVSSTKVVNFGVDEIKSNLERPISIARGNDWILSLFPMPYKIEAGSLNEGDVHAIHYRYKRWFFTNVHEGAAYLKIAEVGERHVRTQFVSDDSYISTYMRLKGTRIDMRPLEDGRTEVTLSIQFHRKLDPVWYFGPLQSYVVEKTAMHLIETVVENATE